MTSMTRNSWRVATIRGVDLRIHVSLAFLLLYVVVIASLQFPAVATQAGFDSGSLGFTPVIWGIFFAVGLLFSVALHEFGHVLVAQAQGVRVRGVVLMMLGGISEMERVPEQPYSEFKLAVVGPIVSLALGGFLLLIRASAQSVDLSFYGFWLGSANLTLGVFNLLPAFPLDGGRALRSVLVARRGVLNGTQTAVRASRVFAWIFGIWGLLTFNVLLALIAFYIYAMAQGEWAMLIHRRLLEGLRVHEVFTRVSAIDEKATLSEAAQQMLRERASVLPIHTIASNQPSVVSLSRLRSFPRSEWGRITIENAKEEVGRTLSLDELISQAVPDFMATSARALPVVDRGELIGVVSYSDLDQLIQFRSLEKAA